ncbi:MAG: paraquat-inducible protein A [Sulfurovum sp.]|nr:paraquat-inducible protein A [Sulfurovum sp.]
MNLYKKILAMLSITLLIFLIYFSVKLIQFGESAKTYKSDYATLHSVQYGMFNSDIWTAKITEIIDKKIETFNLNTTNREEVKGYIQTVIDTLVLEAERVVKERNRGNRGFFDSILGSTKQMITDSLIDFRDLRRRVPEFTDAVMTEVEKPKNQARAKKLIRQKLKAFMAEKFQRNTDMLAYNTVLKKYNATTPETCNTLLDSKIKENHTLMNGAMNIILFLAGGIILLVLLSGVLSSFTLWILSGTTIALLISGLMLPMLDIEAKINKLTFTILDKQVIFENQILFFQSKSISDLVRLLMESDETRMIFVGILLVMFSIIFPVLKLIATTMYFYSKSIIGDNPITRFFALKSTKWSMADVFVVSIFMAYLGLDGVVSNELKQLESQANPINIITTNGTHLEVGFFLFLGFVLTSFVLSLMVEYKHKRD